MRKRVVGRLMNAFDVAPPEINDGYRSDDRREQVLQIVGRVPQVAEVCERLRHESHDVLACGNAGNRPREDEVEYQRRHAQLCHRAAHRFFDHAIDAAAREHRRRFYVERRDGGAQQHHAQYEPGGGFADETFGYAADVKGRRAEIA